MNGRRSERWVGGAYALLCLAWALVYFERFGAPVFLWYCCAANLLVALGLVGRSRLLVSMAAVSVLPVQLAYTLDALVRAMSGHGLFAATESLFDPARPTWLRLMTAHHAFTALVALFALRRWGYDARAFARQTALASVLLLVGYLAADPASDTDDRVAPRIDGEAFDPDYDVNWSHGLGGRPEPSSLPIGLLVMLFGYPLAVHLPTHLALARLYGRPTSR